MNNNKPADVSIRLPKQASLPTPQELIEMAKQSRRAKKRIELPWQPEGRPDPCLVCIFFDGDNNRWTWSIYTTHKSDGELAWKEENADPTKVVIALRDWYTHARNTEGWGQPPAAPAPNQAPQVQIPPGFSPYQQYSDVYPANPYATPSAPMPVWNQYPPQYPYPNYAVPPAPPHWAQGPQMTLGQPGVQPPLPPELWALHAPQRADSNATPMLGDLLVAAGVIPTKTLQAALTLQNASAQQRRRIGEILVNTGALSNQVLDAAVKLQDLARQGAITNQRVTELLRQVHNSGCTVEQRLQTPSPTPAAAPNSAPTLEKPKPSADQKLTDDDSPADPAERGKLRRVLDALKKVDSDETAIAVINLLSTAGIVGAAKVEEHLRTNRNAVDGLQALVVKEQVDVTTLEAAVSCNRLMSLDRMRYEQAVIALGYCFRSRVTLRDAICDLNWLIPLEGIS